MHVLTQDANAIQLILFDPDMPLKAISTTVKELSSEHAEVELNVYFTKKYLCFCDQVHA